MSPHALLRLFPVLVLLLVGVRPAAAQAHSSAPFATPDEAADYMFGYLNQYWFAQFFGSDDGLDYDLLVEYHLYDTQFDWAALYRCPAPIGDHNGVYCHPEQAIFLDRQLMEELTAAFGPWATAHAMAHEWGHHIEWTLDPRTYDAARTDPTVYKGLELLADCFAGASLRPLYDEGWLTPADLAGLREMTRLLGDDRGTGVPLPPGLIGSHGSGAERLAAFDLGFAGGRFGICVSR